MDNGARERISDALIERLLKLDPALGERLAGRQQLPVEVDIRRSHYRIAEGARINLSKRTANVRGLPDDRDELDVLLERERERLDKLQRRFAADRRHKLLLVFQAMDTGGKDGTIRHLCTGWNPQGVRVACFKAPTPAELDRDPLWRIHPHVPARGEIAVFNRSHYEDVLITRVHGVVDEALARRRLQHLRHFEEMLVDEGTTIMKFFLHIDKDEQKRRLQARLSDPDKRWKFEPGDLSERQYWDDYLRVYQEAIRATTTVSAPWFVIPANHKKQRNLVVATLVRRQLEQLDPRYPEPKTSLDGVVVD